MLGSYFPALPIVLQKRYILNVACCGKRMGLNRFPGGCKNRFFKVAKSHRNVRMKRQVAVAVVEQLQFGPTESSQPCLKIC